MIGAGVLLGCIAVLAPAEQPPRDARQAPRTGTATIRGIVQTVGDRPAPVRRARVMLNNSERTLGRTAITDESGAFAFDSLPAGRYSLSAGKDGFVTMNYGAKRPARPGAEIVVREGDVEEITVRMPRGAVIAGAITDIDGQPAPGVTVQALHYVVEPGGERQLVAAGAQSGPTDDRGEYRIFNLPPGDYIVAAMVRQGPTSGAAQVLSQAEVRRALAEVRDPRPRNQPGPPRPSSAPAPISPESRRTVSYATVFYPGTTSAQQARAITLALGEERLGIDFQLEYVPTATVSGMVSIPANISPGTVISLIQQGVPRGMPSSSGVRLTSISGQGRFTFANVIPGSYRLIARGVSRTASGTFDESATTVAWGSADVEVAGEDVETTLHLQPALTISGRVAFDSENGGPSRGASFEVPLPGRLAGVTPYVGLPPLRLTDDWRFHASGIIPLRYDLTTPIRGTRSPIGSWWLKSIVVDGRDILDAPLEIRRSTDDAVVTLSDRASELHGTVMDARGAPVADRYIVVFSADRGAWFPNSRRIVALRPYSDGQYRIRNLPPGDYYVVAHDDLEHGEWFDPFTLEELVPLAARITMAEYENKVHDVTLPGR